MLTFVSATAISDRYRIPNSRGSSAASPTISPGPAERGPPAPSFRSTCWLVCNHGLHFCSSELRHSPNSPDPNRCTALAHRNPFSMDTVEDSSLQAHEMGARLRRSPKFDSCKCQWQRRRISFWNRAHARLLSRSVGSQR